MMQNISISTNKAKLDIPFIYNFLFTSYWAEGRTLKQVEKSIENSTCFGVYLDDKQIGFARVVTDTVVFAYIMDVFIEKSKRGQGYSKQLMNVILTKPEFKEVQKWYLRTKDAQGFYEQFGFLELEDPERTMVKRVK